MPQRLAADQHSSLVQLLPRFIFSASINLALITPPGATVYPVIGNLFDCPGMSLVDRRGILRTITVDVGTIMNVLPYLFLCGCVRNPFNDLPRIFAYNRA